MRRLDPSFLRMAAHLSVWFGLAAVGGYLWQGYRENHWWTFDYIASLSVPFAMMMVACWLGFVPSKLAYDEEGIIIHSWWRGRHEYRWEDVRHYGEAMNVFLLQFGSSQAFQILSQAYPKSDWKQFRDFLRQRYPGRKASGWIGPFGFRWRK